MKRLFLIIGIIAFLFTNSTHAQNVESDSIRIVSDNCATKLANQYLRESVKGTLNKSFKSYELLKKTDFEREINGIFIVTALTSHSKKAIVLKKENRIKLLTFNNTSNSLIELVSFLRDINTTDDKVIEYVDSILIYLKSSNGIKFNTLNNSDWLDCK